MFSQQVGRFADKWINFHPYDPKIKVYKLTKWWSMTESNVKNIFYFTKLPRCLSSDKKSYDEDNKNI